MAVKRLKCKFCSWETPEFFRRSDGKLQSGYSRLEDHVLEAHPAEHDAIIRELDAEFEGKE